MYPTRTFPRTFNCWLLLVNWSVVGTNNTSFTLIVRYSSSIWRLLFARIYSLHPRVCFITWWHWRRRLLSISDINIRKTFCFRWGGRLAYSTWRGISFSSITSGHHVGRCPWGWVRAAISSIWIWTQLIVVYSRSWGLLASNCRVSWGWAILLLMLTIDHRRTVFLGCRCVFPSTTFCCFSRPIWLVGLWRSYARLRTYCMLTWWWWWWRRRRRFYWHRGSQSSN